MKKFAAIFISLMLVALMTISPVVSAADFAEAVAGRIETNGTSNGTLTLHKYQVVPGQEASVDTDAQEPVSGALFVAYRIYDLDPETGLFSVSKNFDLKNEPVSDTLKEYIDNDGHLTFTSTADLEALIPSIQKVAYFRYPNAFSNEVSTGEYKFDSLPLGVYLVVEAGVPEGYAVSTIPFLVSIPQWDEAADGEGGTWNFDIEANPKNDEITLDKVITNSDVTDDDVKSATKNIGDKVEYKVTADIPCYNPTLGEGNEAEELTQEQKDAITYTFVDTMSGGLTYNGDFVAKVVNEDADINHTFTLGTDYTITVTPNPTVKGKPTTITVKFDWNALDAYQGEDITLLYSATLNETAVVGEANVNSAKLQYTNDPRANSKDGPKPGKPSDTPESETKVYTYEMDLTKTFNGSLVKDLVTDTDYKKFGATGVQFTLTVKGEEEPLQFVKFADGSYAVFGDNFSEDNGVLEGTDYEVVTKINPDIYGNLSVKGLAEGTYVLSEVSSIKDYGKLASDVEITLVGGKSGDPKEYDGTLASATANPGGELTINENTAKATNGHFDITVNNVKKQFTLPLTGGAGLLMFTIGGGVVIAGAIILFSLLRKKKTVK